MADALRTGVENSQGDNAIKQETLKILDEAKAIKTRLGDDDAVKKEYNDVRNKTLGSLLDLRIETTNDLRTLTGDINPGRLGEGSISQEELGEIANDFSDLQQVASEQESGSETSEELSDFGNIMLGYIEDTNEAILNGGQEEINSEIGWYITAFGGENGSGDLMASAAYYGALTVLTPETMSISVSRLEQIKNSSDSLETKLFQLSQVLYEVGKEAGAPAELEIAHNLATRTIIQKAIENESGTIAVGFNKSTGYYTTDTITSTSSELEIGSYLCSLNKSGKLSKENLLKPNGIFSPIELFVILERYKNGEFGDENIRGLFTEQEYLENFEENMQFIIQDFIMSSENGEDIISCIQGGINSEYSLTQTIISECELCNKIGNFSLEDIKNISPECWKLLEDTEPEFTKGLRDKEKILESESQVFQNLTNYYINMGIAPDRLNEVEDPLRELIGEMKKDSCSINYIAKIREFNETYFSDIEDIFLSQEDARSIIQSVINLTKTENEIALINLKNELSRTSNPDDILGIKTKIQQLVESGEVTLRQENRLEDVLSFIDILNYTPNAHDILQRPKDINAIQDKETLIRLFQGPHKGELGNILQLGDLNMQFLYDRDVILNFPGKIGADEIGLLPESILNQEDIIIYLIHKSITENQGRAINDILYAYMSYSNTSKKFLDEHLYPFLESLTRDQKKTLRSNIPYSIQRIDSENILGLPEVIGELKSYSYYEEKLQNLQNYRGLDEQRDTVKISEIDTYIERSGRNCHEIIKVLCEKGLLGYTSYAKHQIKKDPDLWGAIIDSGELTSIRFVDANTRASDIFQRRLIESGKIQNWLTMQTMETYITMNSIDDAYTWFEYMKTLDGAPRDVDALIAFNPKILHIIKTVSNSTQEGKSFGSLDIEYRNFAFEVLKNSSHYIDQITEPLSQAQENIHTLLENNTEKYNQDITSLLGSLNLEENEINELRKIIENADGGPIVSDGKMLLEILGSIEDVSNFLQSINDIQIEKIAADRDNANHLSLSPLDYPQKFRENYLEQGEDEAWYYSEENIIALGKTLFQQYTANGGRNFEGYIEYSEIFLEKEFGLSNEQILVITEIYFKGEFNKEYINSITNPDGSTNTDFINDLVNNRLDGKSFFQNYAAEYKGSTINEDGGVLPPPLSTSSQETSNISPQNLYQFGGTQENPTIMTEQGSINITNTDYKILKNNPEAQKNYIDTYEAFKESGLLKLWNIRDSIYTSIANVKGLAFSIDKDYINKNELKILFDSILISIGEKPLRSGTLTTKGIITAMEKRNGRNENGEETQVNSYGETRIESEFLKRYFKKGSIIFGHQEFENALRNK